MKFLSVQEMIFLLGKTGYFQIHANGYDLRKNRKLLPCWQKLYENHLTFWRDFGDDD